MTLPYSPGITLGPKKYSGTGMTVFGVFFEKAVFYLKDYSKSRYSRLRPYIFV
jgi:hypothetical protein